jgi:hypothetical protein
MKLVYKATALPVAGGDIVALGAGETVRIVNFNPPHKASSQGHVLVEPAKGRDRIHHRREYYVSVIGAEWIEREDRDAS